MYLITEQDFQRQYSIPTNQGRTDDGADSVLTQYIDGFVPLFLSNALGYTNFKAFDSYITNGVLSPTAPTIWLELLNGKEYTKNNVLKKWNGLVHSKGAFKESLLVPFVYYNWFSETVGKNGKVINSKNVENVNITQEVTEAWNHFVSLNQSNVNAGYANYSVINGIPFKDWFRNSTSIYVSLIEFLEDNATDYPESNLMTYDIKNQFGL